MTSVPYFMLTPECIVEDIHHRETNRKVSIMGQSFFVFPHVYPSDRFRSSQFILKVVEPLVKDCSVCDMGCGMGIIGQFALRYGAKMVVQADVNPFAVENAKANRKLHKFSDKKMRIYSSDCFDKIPAQKFDLIVFNIPFHTEPFVFNDPLEKAFHDPGFQTLIKFLKQATSFCQPHTEILIVFSNKGDVEGIENIFGRSNFNWSLPYITNTDQLYDTRIYKLQKKSQG